MEDQENKEFNFNDLKKQIMEDEERIIGFCKNIEGYENITNFEVEGCLCSMGEESDMLIDTIYIRDNSDYLNMIVLVPPISIEQLKQNHFKQYKYKNGCKMIERSGYFVILTCDIEMK